MTEIILAILFIPLSAFFFYSYATKKNLNRKNKKFAIFIFIFFFIFAAFRSIYIGNDSESYSIEYENINTFTPFWLTEGRLEPSYQYLCKFIKIYISKDVLALFIITSLFLQFFFVRFMYLNSKKLWLSIFLFVTFQYYFFFVSAIRQGIAQVFCLLAYNYLRKDKLKYFFAYVLLAFTFHYSALVFIILPLLKNIKFTLKKVFLIGLITVVVFILLNPFLQLILPSISYGTDYLDQTEGISDDFSRLGAVFMALTSFFIVLFAFIFGYHKLADKNLSVKYELWCAIFSLIIGVLAIKFGILIRFTYYFGLISVIMIPNIISTIKNIKTKNLMIGSWLVFTFINIFIILYFRPEWFNFYPYEFFWE